MILPPSQWLLAVALLLTGIVHLIPLLGVLSASRLHRLYGVPLDADATTILLLRHRAVLFGLLGVILCAAALRPNWHLGGALIGLVSMLSFVAMAGGKNGYGLAIRRVVRVDIVLSGLVLLSLLARLFWRGQ